MATTNAGPEAWARQLTTFLAGNLTSLLTSMSLDKSDAPPSPVRASEVSRLAGSSSARYVRLGCVVGPQQLQPWDPLPQRPNPGGQRHARGADPFAICGPLARTQ